MPGNETMFFGKIAQMNGLITDKQLKECRKEARRDPPHKEVHEQAGPR
jgi:hypothetical protein